MNKYDRIKKETDEKYDKSNSKKFALLQMKLLYKALLNKEKININSDLSLYMLLNLSKLNDKTVKWFKKNYIEKYNKDVFFLHYIFALNYLTCNEISKEDNNFILTDLETCMKSFVLSGLIKDIEIINKEHDNSNATEEAKKTATCINDSVINNSFRLTLLNGKQIDVSRLFDSQSNAKSANGFCYAYTEVMLNKLLTEGTAYVGYFKDLYGIDCLHTYAVYNGIAYDPGQNIIMNNDDYIRIRNFEVLFKLNKKDLFEQIEYYENNDVDFKSSYVNNIHKLAMIKKLK